MQSRNSNLLILLVLVVVVVLNGWWWTSGTQRPDLPGTSDSPAGVERSEYQTAAVPQQTAPASKTTEILRGTVVSWQDGTPVGGVLLTLNGSSPETKTTTTPADGTFQMPLGTSASWKVRTDHPAYTSMTFCINAPCPEPIELVLIPRGELQAMVVDAQSGVPIDGARLTVLDGKGRSWGGAFSDSDGFIMVRLPNQPVDITPGVRVREVLGQRPVMILAEAEGHQAFKKRASVVDFCTGEKRLLVALEPLLRKVGRVVAPNGSPVPGAHVFWTWRIRKGLASSKDWQDTYADDRGIFEWTGPRITWETIVVADADGFAPGWTHVELADLKGDGEIEIRLSEACSFQGRLTDRAGRGVEGVAVKLFYRDAPACLNNLEFLIAVHKTPSFFTTRTDPTGTFFLDGLPAGNYFVRWKHPDVAAERDVDTEVTLPTQTSWEGTVGEGEAIAGICVTPGGEPIPDVKIYLRVQDEAMPRGWRPVSASHIRYDGQGMFHAVALENAAHQITAYAGDLISTMVELEAFPDDLVLQLNPRDQPPPPGEEKLTLEVNFREAVLDEPWIEVNLAPSGTFEFDKRIVRVKLGTAEIEALASGVYDIQVNGYGYAPILLSGVEVPRENPIRLDLEKAEYVYGTVVADGPTTPRFVDVSDLQGRRLRHVPVGSGGEIVIPGLARGYYIFSSSHGRHVTHRAPEKVLVDPPGEVIVELLEVESSGREEIADS